MTAENIHPWLGVWIHPRRTMNALIERRPTTTVFWLALIGGMVSGLSWIGFSWYQRPDNSEVRSFAVIVAALVSGGIFGLIHLYFMAWLLKITGSWIGGSGDYIALKCAVGWSFYPFIVSNIFSFLSYLAAPTAWLVSLLGAVNVLFAIWGIILYMIFIGAAHRFSAWRGVAAFLLACVIILAALMLVSILVPLLSPLFI